MTTTPSLRPVYLVAAWAAVVQLVCIAVQIAVFAAVPPPGDAAGWFALFHANPLVGLVDSDLLLTVDNLLVVVLYVALFFSLKDRNPGLTALALVLGLVGIAAYLASTMSLEMFALAGQFQSATDPATRSDLVATARGLLLRWQGTAFNAYYVLNGITLLILSSLMLGSQTHGKATARWGLASGVLMVVPSTAGAVGLVFSLLSLVPWTVFSVRLLFTFRRLSRHEPDQP